MHISEERMKELIENLICLSLALLKKAKNKPFALNKQTAPSVRHVCHLWFTP